MQSHLDDLGDFKGDLVGLRETRLADQLHDLRQVLFCLQNLADLGAQGNELRVERIIERL